MAREREYRQVSANQGKVRKTAKGSAMYTGRERCDRIRGRVYARLTHGGVKGSEAKLQKRKREELGEKYQQLSEETKQKEKKNKRSDPNKKRREVLCSRQLRLDQCRQEHMRNKKA